jgi:7-cyano-7-deazaguanine synthase
MRAVVLLSGGLDSTTAAAWAKREGWELLALAVDYGQRHRIELERGEAVARALGCRERRVVKIDLRAIGGSALTDEIAVPKDRPDEAIGHGVPVTYVPARNAVFLSCALGWAEVAGASAIVIGANVLDSSGYPDCRPAFLRAFEAMAAVATAAATERGERVQVLAPLIELSKAGIVKLALELRAPLELTWSCYDPQPGPVSCGRCDSCHLRRKGFAEAGVADPVPYARSR